ncbi:MAG: BlaI/MecI/CopY family transcriptional regulator [Clostridia bacterium]
MSAFKELSATENEIMEVMWEQSEAVPYSFLIDFFNTKRGKEWKRQTLSTYMIKLSEKGLIISQSQGRQMFYSIAMTRADYEKTKANGILDKLYNGSVKNFMTALYDGKEISKNQIEDLKQWLKDK